LWDLLGKALETPVHKLLGGYTDSMRVSHMLGFKPAEELLEEAQRFGDQYGITTFKLKVGRRPLSLDIEARSIERRVGKKDRTWLVRHTCDKLRHTATV